MSGFVAGALVAGTIAGVAAARGWAWAGRAVSASPTPPAGAGAWRALWVGLGLAPPSPVLAGGLLAGFLCVAWSIEGLTAASVVTPAVAAVGLPMLARRLETEPEPAGPVALILLTEQLAAHLASGGSVLHALEAARPPRRALAQDLDQLRRRVRRGAPLQEELDRWARQMDPRLGVGLLADALALAGASGGSRVAALERVAATLRDRRAVALEIAAQASLARASAVVLVVSPVAFAFGLCVIDSRIRAVCTGPAGAACLATGLLVDAVGAVWMRRLVRVAS